MHLRRAGIEQTGRKRRVNLVATEENIGFKLSKHTGRVASVSMLHMGSTADKAGLRLGDLVLSVNGITDPEMMVDAIAHATEGAVLEFSVRTP